MRDQWLERAFRTPSGTGKANCLRESKSMNNAVNDGLRTYNGFAKLLHWSIAVLVILQLGIGWTMPEVHKDTKPVGLIGAHVIVGTLIVLLVAMRIVWRAVRPPTGTDVGPVALVAYQVPDGTTADDIRKLALDVRGRLPQQRPAVVVVAGVPADRPTVVVTVNEPARALGLAAGTLVRSAAQTLGGGGGGRDDVAQGGGAPQGDRTGQAIAEAFDAVRAVVRDSA